MRITLKKAYTDGTVAVDMDPLSLLCRWATSVPPPRLHSVSYAGVLAAASPLRPKIAPKPSTEEPAAASAEPDRTRPAGGYRPWAEFLARTFAVDVLPDEERFASRSAYDAGFFANRLARGQYRPPYVVPEAF